LLLKLPKQQTQLELDLKMKRGTLEKVVINCVLACHDQKEQFFFPTSNQITNIPPDHMFLGFAVPVSQVCTYSYNLILTLLALI
jgi:hypothetical protein